MGSAQLKIFVLGVLFLLLTPHSLFAAQAPDIEQQTHEIAAELRCPVCQNLSVADSPSELAQQMRASIEEQLRQGKTPDEVKQFFVSKYGDWVLLAPPAKGFNLLLWLLPMIGALCGVIFVGFAIRRWARKRATQPADPAALQPPAGEDRRDFLAVEKARLDAEIKELDFDFQAGKLSDADYAALSGDLQLRAAGVARQLAEVPPHVAQRPAAGSSKPRATVASGEGHGLKNWQLAAGAGFLLLLGLGLGVLLTQSVRSRDSGDTMTGDFLTGTQAAGPQEATLARGRAAIEKGDFPQAIEAFKQVLTNDPNNPEALAYMGIMLSQAGHSDGALTAFDRALAADPNFPLALWGKGMLLYRNGGDPAEARRLLEKVSAMMPAGPEKTEVQNALTQMSQSPAAAKPEAAGKTAAGATSGTKIEGVIDVDAKAKANLDARAVLFIVARPSRGGGPPLAVKKIPSPKFPYSYSLSAQDVMMPGAVFSGKLYVTARLDKDGDPLTQSPEDLAGEYKKNPVEVGSKKIDILLAPARPEAR
ncbi:MAG TPA: cytochrome c-type biogenesis protein CcmH [Candidatus Binatia bacterium]|nr:cytochrome c-type biogenesis protein CcmH [Candidatus Binatia bacterium]